MATIFTLSTGETLSLEASASSVVPSDKYVAWATEYGFPTTGTEHAMDGDDIAFCIRAPSFIGTGDFFTLISEGGFELPSTATNLVLPTIASTNLSIPNINRYYTTTGMSATRLGLSFHPPYDAGTLGVKVRRNVQCLLCGGSVTRGSGQVVDFALLIDKLELSFDLYLSTGAGSSIPIYALELGASGYVGGSQVLVGTMPANGKLQVHGALHSGLVDGHVYDAAGAGAARVVRAYLRSSGDLSGAVTSSAGDGSFVVKTKYPGEHYVVALDDDAAPDFNALIFDRVVAQSPY